MVKENALSQELGSLGSAIGRGLLAGIAGTAAITVAQVIDMKLSGRKPSDAPAVVGGKVLGVEPRGPKKIKDGDKKDGVAKSSEKAKNKMKFSQFMHWGYGTGWGVFRGLLAHAGLKGISATAVHFGAIWGTALIMVPGMTKSPPATEWGAEMLTKDALFHLVYAIAAGAAFDAIDED